MCGILGVASTTLIEDWSWVYDGSLAMRHRGPNDSGEWFSADKKVAFAHRRLSIIDTSKAGRQPLSYGNGSIVITFNGEIYNYKVIKNTLVNKGYTFTTETDTEVILASYKEWGAKCVEHLNGMFSFAIYDNEIKRVFVARDRAGEKPLFYRLYDGELRFASELKSLLTDTSIDRKINLQSLDCYLAMGFIPGNLCILEGFNKLPAGHTLSFDLLTGKIDVFEYWNIPNTESEDVEGEQLDDKLVNELDSLLDKSVEQQLVSDVPLGVLLSGGVDSSLITAKASKHKNKIKTFTIGFSGSKKYDETEYARLIANHFGTEHIELEAKQATSSLISLLSKQFCEPIVDSSMIPTYLVSELVKDHCTVVLGGDGADELFGGYSHYNRLMWLEKKFGKVPMFIRGNIAKFSDQILSDGFKGKNWLSALDCDFESDLPLIATYFSPAMRRRLLGAELITGSAEAIDKARVPLCSGLLQRATRMDFKNYLAEDILVKIDRSSMLNSIEMRAPFLDKDIIEFAFLKVPTRLKATASERKIILKKLAQKILPSNFNANRKQGFSIPISDWLKEGSFRTLFYEVLLDSKSIFDRSYVLELLKGQDRGMVNGERLFALVLFELWRREYDAYI